jgi:TFIIF-interacting CTD phosphatase-like protein
MEEKNMINRPQLDSIDEEDNAKVGEEFNVMNADEEVEEEEEEEKDIEPEPQAPFLPPKDPNDKRKFTLILDLDETLIHFDDVRQLIYNVV